MKTYEAPAFSLVQVLQETTVAAFGDQQVPLSAIIPKA